MSVQTVDELGGTGSVLARQRRDHIDLDGLLQRLTATSGREQDEIVIRLRRLVFSHAFAEETVLWPAVRRALPDGDDLTLRIEQEHQHVNELTTRLERTGHDDPQRPQLVERLVAVLREDVRDEEDMVLPRLQAALSRHQLQRLGRAWELVRRASPTRPHPTVSRRPPGNALAGLPLSALDRTRDQLDRIERRSPPPVAVALRHLSGALATAAAGVERLPAVRRGEHPSTRAQAQTPLPDGTSPTGARL